MHYFCPFPKAITLDEETTSITQFGEWINFYNSLIALTSFCRASSSFLLNSSDAGIFTIGDLSQSWAYKKCCTPVARMVLHLEEPSIISVVPNKRRIPSSNFNYLTFWSPRVWFPLCVQNLEISAPNSYFRLWKPYYVEHIWHTIKETVRSCEAIGKYVSN